MLRFVVAIHAAGCREFGLSAEQITVYQVRHQLHIVIIVDAFVLFLVTIGNNDRCGVMVIFGRNFQFEDAATRRGAMDIEPALMKEEKPFVFGRFWYVPFLDLGEMFGRKNAI